MKSVQKILFLFLSGILSSAAILYSEIGFIEWVSLIPAAVVLLSASSEKSKLGKCYLYGFCFFEFFYLLIFIWLGRLYPLSFTEIDNKTAAFIVYGGWILFSSLKAFFSALIFPLFAALNRTLLAKMHPVCSSTIAASLWSLLEWSESLVTLGIPFGKLSLSQIATPVLIQSSALFGSYFITFIIVFVNFSLAYILTHTEKRRILSFVTSGIFLLNTTFGFVRMNTVKFDNTTPVSVAAIQGNIPTHQKWDSAYFGYIFDIYIDYTQKAAEEGAKIIVWPETAIPYVLLESEFRTKQLQVLARNSSVVLMVGTFTEDENGNTYNSVVTFLPDGSISENIYSKIKLVPFGEYIPFQSILTKIVPDLRDINLFDDMLLAGDSPNIESSEYGNIGFLICFDSIYEALARDSVAAGAEMFVLPTNDIWFYDSPACYMHNAHAKFRAIETGRYILRAGNSGISSIISPFGTSQKETAPLVDAYIVDEVYMISQRTLYDRIGNMFLLLCLLYIFMCQVSECRIFRFKKIK